MCGRYGLALTSAELSALFDEAEVPEAYRVRFNIAPTQEALIARAVEPGVRLDFARWGFERAGGGGGPLINARSEGVGQRAVFRDAFRHRRCLVPASGFFEWRRGPGGRVPYWISAPQALTFAALWAPAGAGVTPCFTILTRSAPAALARIHDRVPLLVGAEERGAWLDNGTPPREFQTWTEDEYAALTARPVSDRVNRVGEDDPALIQTVAEPLELEFD